MGPIGFVKSGIVPKAAVGCGFGRGKTVHQKLPGPQQTLNQNIVPNAGAGGIFKDPTDLGLTHKELLADLLQGKFVGKVFVDILNQPFGCFGRGGIFWGWPGGKNGNNL